ncbi:MAG: hypothetical protein K8R88_09445 [Armatimonadetes bacterium]|nr:hypothetical protein [Armatimonadota bacterium]
MNHRGLRAYLIATVVYATVVWAICRLGDDWLTILAYGAIAVIVWSSLRLITISIRRFNWLLSLGCSMAFCLEISAIAGYGSYVHPEEYGHRTVLTFLQTIAICAFVFGRILDFYILKPHFPRKSKEETHE